MADSKRSVTIICSYGVEQLYANYGAQSNVYKSIVLTAVQFYFTHVYSDGYHMHVNSAANNAERKIDSAHSKRFRLDLHKICFTPVMRDFATV